MATIPGIYQHYKGPLYRVLFTAFESTNDREREPLVVYVSLEKGSINVRREAEFHEFVMIDGKWVSRFLLRWQDEVPSPLPTPVAASAPTPHEGRKP